MNQNLILKHKKNKNPYGLYHESGLPYSKVETIVYFQNLGLNDDELNTLNKYINENKCHTFYDNAYMLFYEDGMPLNFIEGLRTQASLDEDYERHHNVLYECHFDDEYWDAYLDNIEDYEYYISLDFIGAGSKIHALIGETTDYIWIAFPYQYKATTLAHPEDIYWNLNELIQLFESTKDGVTVAYGLKKLYKEKMILKGDVINDY